jgi:hypothetical protein
MLELSEITIILAGFIFIAVFIILLRIHKDFNKLIDLLTIEIRKTKNVEEKTTWNLDFIKDKIKELSSENNGTIKYKK